jgi:hypothetical protein
MSSRTESPEDHGAPRPEHSLLRWTTPTLRPLPLSGSEAGHFSLSTVDGTSAS